MWCRFLLFSLCFLKIIIFFFCSKRCMTSSDVWFRLFNVQMSWLMKHTLIVCLKTIFIHESMHMRHLFGNLISLAFACASLPHYISIRFIILYFSVNILRAQTLLDRKKNEKKCERKSSLRTHLIFTLKMIKKKN